MFDFILPKVTQVDVTELKKAIDNHEDFVLLDVRTSQEYERGKINGSINLPLDEVKENIEKLIPDKNKKVFVYCLSGSRSIMAVDLMQKLGFTNTNDVKNGLLAWRVSNFPTV